MLGRSSSIPLFRVAGINVGANWTWLLAFLYLIVVLTGDYQVMLGEGSINASFAFGVAASALFFLSIIVHEFGHAIVARRNGIGILGIELWMLGGLASLDRDPATPGVEFRVAAAGPLMTLVVALLSLGGAFMIDAGQARDALGFVARPGDDPWLSTLAWLGLVNLFLLAFNLIPAYPLDGGRMARATVWKLTGDRQKATVVAGTLGRAFGWLLIAYGVFLLAATNATVGGMMFVFMGFMLSQSARASIAGGGVYEEALHMTVADVMDREPVVVPGSASVERALNEFFWRYHWPWFPVTNDESKFLGLVEQKQVDDVPEAERPTRLVSQLVDLKEGLRNAVDQDMPLTALLADEQLQGAGALMVTDNDGVLRGVLTLDHARRAFSKALGTAAPKQDESAPAAPDQADRT